MKQSDATNLLRHSYFNSEVLKSWADLGAGSGTFTLALANLLPAGSIVYAMDTNKQALDQIPSTSNGVGIQKFSGDILKDHFPFDNLDGILMANSLHYIKEKNGFIQNAIQYLKADGVFLIIEYDTDIANQWVPYPVKFSALKKIFSMSGFSKIEKLGEMPSVYNEAVIYSALIQSRT